MMLLQLRVSDTPDRQIVEVDRMSREDATPREQATVDTIHDRLKQMFERSPSRCGPIIEIRKNEASR